MSISLYLLDSHQKTNGRQTFSDSNVEYQAVVLEKWTTGEASASDSSVTLTLSV